jgi:hypothetical protein
MKDVEPPAVGCTVAPLSDKILLLTSVLGTPKIKMDET